MLTYLLSSIIIACFTVGRGIGLQNFPLLFYCLFHHRSRCRTCQFSIIIIACFTTGCGVGLDNFPLLLLLPVSPQVAGQGLTILLYYYLFHHRARQLWQRGGEDYLRRDYSRAHGGQKSCSSGMGYALRWRPQVPPSFPLTTGVTWSSVLLTTRVTWSSFLLTTGVTWSSVLLTTRVTWSSFLLTTRVTWSSFLLTTRITWLSLLLATRVTWSSFLLTTRVTWSSFLLPRG